jgi:hypothetical protein
MNTHNSSITAADDTRAAANLTRRSILGGLAAATALVAADHAGAVGNPDAELFRIEAEFNVASDAMQAACDKAAAVDERVRSLLRPMPAWQPLPDDLDAALHEMTIKDLFEDHPLAPALRKHTEDNDQRHEAWKAECDDITRQSGLPEAEEEQERTIDAAGDIAESLLDMPALTLAGMLVKLRVHERWTFDESELLKSIAADIERMAGGRAA